MKAIVYKKYGSPDVFEPLEVEKPTPEPNEVLIRIYATTVTTADCMMRRGDTFLSRILLGLLKPKDKFQILGTEFSVRSKRWAVRRKSINKVMKFTHSEALEPVVMPNINV